MPHEGVLHRRRSNGVHDHPPDREPHDRGARRDPRRRPRFRAGRARPARAGVGRDVVLPPRYRASRESSVSAASTPATTSAVPPCRVPTPPPSSRSWGRPRDRRVHLDPQHGRVDDRHLRQRYRAHRVASALTSMSGFGSYCLTEPGAGSDAGAIATSAIRVTGDDGGDEFVLTGVKQFISGAGEASVYIVMARSGEPGLAASRRSSFPPTPLASRSARSSTRWAGTRSPPVR